MNYRDPTTFFYLMRRFVAAHEGISHWFALGCVVHLPQRVLIVSLLQTTVSDDFMRLFLFFLNQKTH